jgi:hypothetical protein
MRFFAALICLSMVALAPLRADAQDETTMTAYSVMAGKEVLVTVVKVERTPMNYEDFHTLLTGTI